jgi:hypothetical protein
MILFQESLKLTKYFVDDFLKDYFIRTSSLISLRFVNLDGDPVCMEHSNKTNQYYYFRYVSHERDNLKQHNILPCKPVRLSWSVHKFIMLTLHHVLQIIILLQ